MMVSMKEFMDLGQFDLEDILTVIKDIFVEYYKKDSTESKHRDGAEFEDVSDVFKQFDEVPDNFTEISSAEENLIDFSLSDENFSTDLLDSMVVQEVTVETEPSDDNEELAENSEGDPCANLEQSGSEHFINTCS